ncbi:MAG: ABC transporter permease [Clostridia bacterium]|nr:ABC transporter permease [Clostridia bacterium]
MGIFLFSGLNAVGRNVKTSIDEFYNSQNLADYTVLNRKIDLDQASLLNGEFNADFYYKYDTITTQINGVNRQVNLQLFSTMDFNVNIPSVVQGKLPTRDMEGLIDLGFAQTNGTKIGDVITLKVDDEVFSITITGIAIFPDSLYKGDSIPKKDELAVIRVYAPNLDNYNSFYVDSDFNISQLKEKLTSVSGQNFYSARIDCRDDTISVWRKTADIELINSLMKVLPVVCLVALCLILYINTAKRIEDERYNIGVLTACGLDKKKVIISYVLPMLIWVVVAGVIGAVLGILILPDIYITILTRFYTLPSIVGGSYFYSLLLPLVVLVLITLASLFLAIASLFRKTPVELMRGKAKKSVKILSRSKLPIAYKLSFRNAISYKKKFLFTTLSATLCLALLLTAFLLDNSVVNLQNTIYNDYYNYDTTIKWHSRDNIKYQDIENEAKNSPCFENVMYCLELAASCDDKNVSITVLDGDNPCYNLYDGKEKITIDNEGVYVPESFGNIETVTITLFSSQAITLELSVAGTYTDIGTFGIIIPLEALKNQAPMAYWYLMNSTPDKAMVYCKSAQGASKQDIESFVSSISQGYGETFSYMEHSIKTDRYSKLFVVLDITEVLLFVVCGVIMVLLILNISCLSINERVKDYTIFKAMGVSEKKFNSLSSIENYLSIFFAYLLSIPLGFIITNPIIKVVTRATRVVVYAHAFWWSFVVLFVCAAIITAISNVLINKRISKINVANTLKIKE